MSPLARAVPALLLAALALLLAAHLALLPDGRWQADEYLQIAFFRDGGSHAFARRFLGWSPRPLSELIDASYAAAVLATHRPLIAPLLALCWAAVAAALWAGLGPGRHRALVAATLAAAFLLGHRLADMAYWPIGALAYLPAFAGCAWTVLAAASGRPAWRRATAAGLVIAAFSAEIGALFAALAAPALALAEPPGTPSRTRALWAVPAAAAALVIVLLATGRIAQSIERMVPGPLFHHPLASLAAGFRQWLPVIGRAPLPHALLVLGLAAIWRSAPRPAPPARRAAALTFACLATILLSLAAADFQFGLPCCERHDTFRDGLLILALFPVATWLAPRLPPRAWLAPAGALALALALAPATRQRLPELLHDLRQMPAAQARFDRDWRAAFAVPPSPGTPMLLHPLPLGRITGGWAPTPGLYTLQSPDWHAAGILRFFNRQRLLVLPPESP